MASTTSLNVDEFTLISKSLEAGKGTNMVKEQG
jgi:hypothetical protein